MRRLLLRRLVLLVPTLLGVGLLVAGFLRLVPGDPVEIMLGESATPGDVAALRHELGLDQPLPAQLVGFLARAARGDLGRSITFRAPVLRVVLERYPATLELAAAALVLALTVAVPLGVAAAVRPRSLADRLVRIVSLAGVCLPSFWLGPLLVLVFSLHLGWLPVSGRGTLRHLVLPAVTLASGMTGILVRLTRTSVLAVLREDFVRTARAKGANEWRVLAQEMDRAGRAQPPRQVDRERIPRRQRGPHQRDQRQHGEDAAPDGDRAGAASPRPHRGGGGRGAHGAGRPPR